MISVYSSVMSMEFNLTAGELRFEGSRAGMESKISNPIVTSPKTECLLSNHGVGMCVKKNCDPFVFGPAFAIDKTPGLLCRNEGWNSSENL